MDDILAQLVNYINDLPTEQKIEALNHVKSVLHEISPFKNEPVDCIIWVKNDTVEANDYNPNVVAPPEMRLLKHSIKVDHFTMPIVTWNCETHREIVDGFHRSIVGTDEQEITSRLLGYLPVSTVNKDREDKGDRMGSTYRHNYASGKATVSGLSDMVMELARRNWTDKKIAKELGMEPDEVLRLKQITGLADLFADKEFSEAWEVSYD